ncbi:PREDICTED: calmodulin-binding transcription activator 1-like [Condylura cristata]|uniref:calmodulin-binding transcription activator 1-like n=1 Tax=Condylura cristata TaxID=143302 RepID=UPI00064344DA|nr:PREDICTED: calmodulin-binding transcription activator 1-like [Condylura cristata]
MPPSLWHGPTPGQETLLVPCRLAGDLVSGSATCRLCGCRLYRSSRSSLGAVLASTPRLLAPRSKVAFRAEPRRSLPVGQARLPRPSPGLVCAIRLVLDGGRAPLPPSLPVCFGTPPTPLSPSPRCPAFCSEAVSPQSPWQPVAPSCPGRPSSDPRSLLQLQACEAQPEEPSVVLEAWGGFLETACDPRRKNIPSTERNDPDVPAPTAVHGGQSDCIPTPSTLAVLKCSLDTVQFHQGGNCCPGFSAHQPSFGFSRKEAAPEALSDASAAKSRGCRRDCVWLCVLGHHPARQGSCEAARNAAHRSPRGPQWQGPGGRDARTGGDSVKVAFLREAGAPRQGPARAGPGTETAAESGPGQDELQSSSVSVTIRGAGQQTPGGCNQAEDRPGIDTPNALGAEPPADAGCPWNTANPGSRNERPQNGSMILYNRKKVKYRKDGYCWKKRKDGKTTREDHMKLKVQGVECLYGCYVHSSIIPTFHRRCYWLLQNPDIVLVHYLNVPAIEDCGKPCGPILCSINTDKKEWAKWTKEELIGQLKPMFHGIKWTCSNGNSSSGFSVEQLVQQILDSHQTKPQPRPHNCLCAGSLGAGSSVHHKCNSAKHRVISPKVEPRAGGSGGYSEVQHNDVSEGKQEPSHSKGSGREKRNGKVAKPVLLHQNSTEVSSTNQVEVPDTTQSSPVSISSGLNSDPDMVDSPVVTGVSSMAVASVMGSLSQSATVFMSEVTNEAVYTMSPTAGPNHHLLSPDASQGLVLAVSSDGHKFAFPATGSSESLSMLPTNVSEELVLSTSLDGGRKIPETTMNFDPDCFLNNPKQGQTYGGGGLKAEMVSASVRHSPPVERSFSFTTVLAKEIKTEDTSFEQQMAKDAYSSSSAAAASGSLTLTAGSSLLPSGGGLSPSTTLEQMDFSAIDSNKDYASSFSQTGHSPHVHQTPSPSFFLQDASKPLPVEQSAHGGLSDSGGTFVMPTVKTEASSQTSSCSGHVETRIESSSSLHLMQFQANFQAMATDGEVTMETSQATEGGEGLLKPGELQACSSEHYLQPETTGVIRSAGGVPLLPGSVVQGLYPVAQPGLASTSGMELSLDHFDISFSNQFSDLINDFISVEGGSGAIYGHQLVSGDSAALPPSEDGARAPFAQAEMCVPCCSPQQGSLQLSGAEGGAGALAYMHVAEVVSAASGPGTLGMLQQSGRVFMVTDYSPDLFPQGGVKVLITGPWQEASNNYSCLFDQISVPASLIQPGVLRCYCPAHDTGLVTLQVAFNNQIISNSVVFEYKARALPTLPSSQHDWLSLDDNQFRMSILERLEQMERRMAEMSGPQQHKQGAGGGAGGGEISGHSGVGPPRGRRAETASVHLPCPAQSTSRAGQRPGRPAWRPGHLGFLRGDPSWLTGRGVRAPECRPVRVGLPAVLLQDGPQLERGGPRHRLRPVPDLKTKNSGAAVSSGAAGLLAAERWVTGCCQASGRPQAAAAGLGFVFLPVQLLRGGAVWPDDGAARAGAALSLTAAHVVATALPPAAFAACKGPGYCWTPSAFMTYWPEPGDASSPHRVTSAGVRALFLAAVEWASGPPLTCALPSQCAAAPGTLGGCFESRVVVVCEKMMSRACWAKSKHLIHSKTFRGMTLLHLAAAQGYATLIQTLIKWRTKHADSIDLELEVDPLNVDHFSCTPLMWACALGHLEAAVVLYKWDRRAISIPDSLGRLPLGIARSRGHVKLAECLEHLQRDEQAQLGQSPRAHCPPGEEPDPDSWMAQWHSEATHSPEIPKGVTVIASTNPELRRPRSEPSNYYSSESHKDYPAPKKHKLNPEHFQARQEKLLPTALSLERPNLRKQGPSSKQCVPEAISPSEGVRDYSRDLSPPTPEPAGLRASGSQPVVKWSSKDLYIGVSTVQVAGSPKGTSVGKEAAPPQVRPREPMSVLMMANREVVDTEMGPCRGSAESEECSQPLDDIQVNMMTLAEHIIEATPDRIKQENFVPMEPAALERTDTATVSSTMSWLASYLADVDHLPSAAQIRSTYNEPLTPTSNTSLSPVGSPVSEIAFEKPSLPSAADWSEFLSASTSEKVENDFAQLTLSDHEQRELYEAARLVQTAFRKYRGRPLREQQEVAAAVIQRCYRKYKQLTWIALKYALYKKMTQAAILIQSKFRSYYEQKKFQQSRRAAVLIQKYYRSYKKLGKRRQARRTAVIVQQKLRSSLLTKKQDQAARKIMRFLRRCRHSPLVDHRRYKRSERIEKGQGT